MSEPLLAAPNFSAGRDRTTVEAIAGAFSETGGARVLDLHSDADHDRSVVTLAGTPEQLLKAILAGAREAVEWIDLRTQQGVHPRVGTLDVAPIVYRSPEQVGVACATALTLGDLLAREIGIPVFLYGQLAHGRTRADLRRGGPEALAQRVTTGELAPDYGPADIGPRSGATLVTARPPLVAFNVNLASGATLEQARAIAAAIREGGPAGLPGLRAIGLHLAGRDIVQVSTNVEDHLATPLAQVVEAVRAHAPITHAELVGLAPQAAFDGFPQDVEITGFDPDRHILENRLHVS